MIHQIPTYRWPEPLKTIENAVWNIIEIEDFTGKRQAFQLKRYVSDILYISPISGEFQWIEIEIDLGVSSILSHVYVKRIFYGNVVLFHEWLLNLENQSKAEQEQEFLDVKNIIQAMKSYYRRQIQALLRNPWNEWLVQNLIDDLQKKWINLWIQ